MAAISDKAIKKNTTPYKYNAGSELEEELNYYSTFYRKYDAQIGRFTGVDILSESSAGLTPYQFGGNNPVMYNDPSGAKETVQDYSAQWSIILENLFSDEHPFGGSWTPASGGGGGDYSYFGSKEEAFGYGASYMTASNLWGSQPGFASSFKEALGKFNGGQYTANVNTGYINGIEDRVKEFINNGSYISAANAIVNYFKDIFTVDPSSFRIGSNTSSFFTSQQKDSYGQYIVNVSTQFMDAFANGTAINTSAGSFIPTFNDLVRTIYHEAFVHMNQNLGTEGFESAGSTISGGAAREMEGYWRMFTDKLNGVGSASANYMRNEWNIFVNYPTTNGATRPSFQEMSSNSQQNWVGAYIFIIIFLGSF